MLWASGTFAASDFSVAAASRTALRRSDAGRDPGHREQDRRGRSITAAMMGRDGAALGDAAAAAPTGPSAPPPRHRVRGQLRARRARRRDWEATGDAWQIEGGRLCGKGAHNHGVWLRRKLPVNARIEFDAVTDSPDGDLKAEIWGDGASAATGTTYNDATSYLTIFGGWKNTVPRARAPRTSTRPIGPRSRSTRLATTSARDPSTSGQVYHFKIERTDGKTIVWSVGDIVMFRFADPEPLTGPGHDHFGFNDWEVPVCFDNVSITPL